MMKPKSFVDGEEYSGQKASLKIVHEVPVARSTAKKAGRSAT